MNGRNDTATQVLLDNYSSPSTDRKHFWAQDAIVPKVWMPPSTYDQVSEFFSANSFPPPKIFGIRRHTPCDFCGSIENLNTAEKDDEKSANEAKEHINRIHIALDIIPYTLYTYNPAKNITFLETYCNHLL